MTTNLGTRDIAKGQQMGFQVEGDTTTNYERMKQRVNEELKQHFRPEFLNRVDDTIVFPQLQKEEIVKIVDLFLARLDERMADQGMRIELTQKAKDTLADRGYDPVLGARPLRRTIQQEIEDQLSERILFDELRSGQTVYVDVEGEGTDAVFTFRGVEEDRVPVKVGADSAEDEEGTGAIPEADSANAAAARSDDTPDDGGQARAESAGTQEL